MIFLFFIFCIKFMLLWIISHSPGGPASNMDLLSIIMSYVGPLYKSTIVSVQTHETIRLFEFQFKSHLMCHCHISCVINIYYFKFNYNFTLYYMNFIFTSNKSPLIISLIFPQNLATIDTIQKCYYSQV